MKISTILDHIDSTHMALPEFQRGYVWNRDQVRGLMHSLYRRFPVGSLLVWATESKGAEHRGDDQLAPGIVKLLLDGQQRMTSLYGIARGAPPKFFEGNEAAFKGLYFHLEREEFEFYSPVKMGDDPLWVDVTALMKAGNDGVGEHITRLGARPELQSKIGAYLGRLSRILGIRDIDLHVEEVTGADKNIDVVVDIFNLVNSSGTKLSKGDLALAKICATFPDARGRMKEILARWEKAGYRFDLDWLLRNVNAVAKGEAKFHQLHDIDAEGFVDGLRRTEKAIDYLLNTISGRLGLDHDGVLFGRYAFPLMCRYVNGRGGHLPDAVERDKLLFWFLESAMWGRFSGSTESMLDRDLKSVEQLEGGLDRLVTELRLWRGGLSVEAEHFGGWSLGARFYPVLYLLTRVGRACDWGTGLALSHHLLGKMSRLEVHHIFPKARLYKAGFKRAQVNAISNFCFQTKETNLWISDRDPVEYFAEVEKNHPGALASQWVPTDPKLWKTENYLSFLEERKARLAEAMNAFLADLLHGDLGALRGPADASRRESRPVPPSLEIAGGVESEAEEELLRSCNDWVVAKGLSKGEYLYELSDRETGEPRAVLDLAWPSGLQEGLSQPVAVLIDEPSETLAAANALGFRYFTSVDAFKQYVATELLVSA